LFAKEARAMEAAAAGDDSLLAGLEQLDLSQPESMEDLEDPELFDHIDAARAKFLQVQQELERVPTVAEIEKEHTTYSRSWGAFKDKLYGVDMKIKALKTDNEAVRDNLEIICAGQAPPKFPEDPVEALGVLGEWVDLNTEKTVELMDLNQRLILDTNTNYRGYETIFAQMHKALKAQESVIRQQTAILNSLTHDGGERSTAARPS
jgi:hypothetical protein